MAERLTVPTTERVVISSDQLPAGLAQYDGLERIVDENGTRYFPLKRGRQLSGEEVENAFETDDRSLEDAITPSTDLEQLRQQFEDYKREAEDRIQSFEAQLSEAEIERDKLLATIRELRGEHDIPEPQESDNRFMRGWNQVTGRIGNFVLGRQIALQDGLDRYVYRRDGRTVIVNEEVKDGYPESSRRAGTAVIIGAVAVGATALITWWLTKNGNGDTAKTVTDFDILRADVTSIETDINHPDYGLEALDTQQEQILENQEKIIDRQQEIINNPDWGLKAVDNEMEDIQRQLSAGGEFVSGFEANSLNYYGDTIWYHVEDSLRAELGYQPSVSQIHQATQRVLEINGLSWTDARHLPLGYDFKIPANLVR
jgi:hypothetical protein